jgi:prepilin-type N-terminal cleavage/methylation domain-containing protein
VRGSRVAVVRGSRRAYTLIEIVVVLVLLGILSTAALVMGASNRDAAVDSTGDLAARRVIQAQTTFSSNYGSYTPAPEDLSGVGRDLLVVVGEAVEGGDVSISVGTGGTLAVAARSPTGGCFAYQVSPLNRGGTVTAVELMGTCSSVAALPGDETAVAPVPIRQS